MKVTKYPQSCLVLEKDSHRIVIDLGSVALAKFKLAEFGKIDAVLYTHQHTDHYESSVVHRLLQEGVMLYGNADVAGLIGEKAMVVHDGVTLTVFGFEVTPYNLPHQPLADGAEVPPNTGFLIDGHFFHPGDGLELEGLQAPDVALPIAGPSANFDNVSTFARSLGAKRIIPIHYDVFKADPEEFKARFREAEVIVLKDGESVEI